MTCLCSERIGKSFSACFVNEKYFWKVLSICCTVLLLIQLLWDFFWIKPTVSSFETIKLSQDIFPDILVCKDNGFELKELERYGYSHNKIGDYVYGIGKNNKFVGWSGLDRSDPLRKAFKQFKL